MTDHPDHGHHLDGVVRPIVERLGRRHVGLAVGVTAAGTRFTMAAGERRRGDGRPPDEHTSFQIGSITKVFTALLLADAVDRGEVALDQPVHDIVADAASHPDGRPITLLDLATHTSGLPRLPPGFRKHAAGRPEDPYSGFTSEHLANALSKPPPRPPGGRPRYSNLGMGALGEALARVTTSSFGTLVAERITGPLGMPDTTIEAPDNDDQVAAGHTRGGRPTSDWTFEALAGAGALRSTTDDLLRFLAAHLHPEDSPLAHPIAMAREPRAAINRRLSVSLGWHVLQRRGSEPWWWHNGGTGGFRSFIGFAPEAEVGVVVLGNSPRSVDRIGGSLLKHLT